MTVLLSFLVAVPPVTETLTTGSKEREVSEGMMFSIIGRNYVNFILIHDISKKWL